MTRLQSNILTIILMALAPLFSVYFFINQSLRLDEAQTMWQTDRFPIGILRAVGADVHVPLYHMLVYLWQLFFGNDVSALRIYSLMFFIATIPLLSYLSESVYRSRRVAVFAAAMFAFSPFMNWYGNEIRMYSMLVFFTVLNQIFYVKLIKSPNIRVWIGYAISGVLGAYTHYYFAFVLLSQAVFYFAYRDAFPKKTLKRFMIVAGIVIASLLPWLIYVVILGQISNSEPLLIRPGVIEIFNTFAEFMFGVQSTPINSFLVALWPLIMLAWLFSLEKENIASVESTYLFFSVIIPISIAFVVSVLYRPIYLERYLIFTLPAFAILVSAMITSYSKIPRTILTFGILATMLVTLGVESLNKDTPLIENYEGAAQILEAQSTPSDVIVLSAPFTIYPVEYYYQGPSTIDTLPIWNRYVTGPIPAFDASTLPTQVQQIAGTHDRLWLLLSYDQGYETTIRTYFDTHYQRLKIYNLSPDMSLALYQLRYDTNSQ